MFLGAVSGSPFVLSAADAGGGLISYSIASGSAGHFDLVSNLNVPSLASVGGGVGAAITSATTGFFQGASAFVSTPQNAKPNQVDGGVWMRSADGVNTIVRPRNSRSARPRPPRRCKPRPISLAFRSVRISACSTFKTAAGTRTRASPAAKYYTSSSEQDGSATTSNFRVPFVGFMALSLAMASSPTRRSATTPWYGDVSNATAGLANARLDGEELCGQHLDGLQLPLRQRLLRRAVGRLQLHVRNFQLVDGSSRLRLEQSVGGRACRLRPRPPRAAFRRHMDGGRLGAQP